MIPRDFALSDALECAAYAVDEAEHGRAGEAERAWLEAYVTASGLFAPHSAGNDAIGVLIAASRPSQVHANPAALYTALDAASLAAVTAIEGDEHGMLRTALPHAEAAAIRLEAPLRDALAVILAAVRRIADREGVS